MRRRSPQLGQSPLILHENGRTFSCPHRSQRKRESSCADGDGYGWYASEVCEGGADVDCDDTDPAVNPGATEIVDNGIDDDCDPSTPSGCSPQAIVKDAHGKITRFNLTALLIPIAVFVGVTRRKRLA